MNITQSRPLSRPRSALTPSLCIVLFIFGMHQVQGAGNELFEIKTAAKSLKKSSVRVLSCSDPKTRAAIRKAKHVKNVAKRAYRKCPERPTKARRSVDLTGKFLGQYERKLSNIDSTDNVALAEFASDISQRVDDLLYSDEVCDTGETIIQAELNYDIDPAPFVNFARGWGDMEFGSHGTFADFVSGAAAPDHIHSNTYYGVVIKGTIKNPFGQQPNDQVSSAVALTSGSFWHVPANVIHTTACVEGENCLFYFHSRDNFDFDTDVTDGEPTPETSQEITLEEVRANLVPISPFAKMYTVWGDREMGAHGTFGEFIPGGASPAHIHSHSYHGVVISGIMVNPFSDETINDTQQLESGDYWFVPAGVEHVTACVSAEPCLFYFHAEGEFDFLAAE